MEGRLSSSCTGHDVSASDKGKAPMAQMPVGSQQPLYNAGSHYCFDCSACVYDPSLCLLNGHLVDDMEMFTCALINETQQSWPHLTHDSFALSSSGSGHVFSPEMTQSSYTQDSLSLSASGVGFAGHPEYLDDFASSSDVKYNILTDEGLQPGLELPTTAFNHQLDTLATDQLELSHSAAQSLEVGISSEQEEVLQFWKSHCNRRGRSPSETELHAIAQLTNLAVASIREYLSTASPVSPTQPEQPESTDVETDESIYQEVAKFARQRLTHACANPQSKKASSHHRYRCTFGCRYSSHDWDTWRRHLKVKYPQTFWVCKLCHKAKRSPCVWHRKDKLADHMKVVHPSIDKPERNEICEASRVDHPANFPSTCPFVSRNGPCGFRPASWNEYIEHCKRHFESLIQDGPWQLLPNNRRPHDDNNDQSGSGPSLQGTQGSISPSSSVAQSQPSSGDAASKGRGNYSSCTPNHQTDYPNIIVPADDYYPSVQDLHFAEKVCMMPPFHDPGKDTHFSLVDVEQQCTIPGSFMLKYLALDYSKAIQNMPSSVGTRIPFVAKAIAMTRDMGYRYLWVDAAKTSGNDLIYNRALLTIFMTQCDLLTERVWHFTCHYKNLGTVLKWSEQGKVSISCSHVRNLGHGAYGIVDEVRVSGESQSFARKMYLHWKRTDGEESMPVKELEMLQKLEHENIPKFVAAYVSSSALNILMLPVAECNLKEFLGQAQQRPDKRAHLVEWFSQLASALSYMHGQSCQHMDIKPANILVKNQHVLLSDFGTSSDFSSVASSNAWGGGIMTPKYCAPEVARRARRGRKADVFSLGCVFLEMITVGLGESLKELDQHLGFRKNSRDPSAIYSRHIDKLQVWLKTLYHHASASIHSVVLDATRRMLDFEPAKRPGADEVFNTLVRCLAGPIIQQPIFDIRRRQTDASQIVDVQLSAMLPKGQVDLLDNLQHKDNHASSRSTATSSVALDAAEAGESSTDLLHASQVGTVRDVPAEWDSDVQKLDPSPVSSRQTWKRPMLLDGASETGGPISKRTNNRRDSIAIVGLSWRNSDFASLEHFWDVLAAGLDSCGKIPTSRFDAMPIHHGHRRDYHTRQSYHADYKESFDAEFFNLLPREVARAADPMQRMLLMTAYEALENAGYVPTSGAIQSAGQNPNIMQQSSHAGLTDKDILALGHISTRTCAGMSPPSFRMRSRSCCGYLSRTALRSGNGRKPHVRPGTATNWRKSPTCPECDAEPRACISPTSTLLDDPYNVGRRRTSFADRISYFFDFGGPSLLNDTACSSSLLSLQTACSGLWNNEPQVAVSFDTQSSDMNVIQAGCNKHNFKRDPHHWCVGSTGRSKQALLDATKSLQGFLDATRSVEELRQLSVLGEQQLDVPLERKRLSKRRGTLLVAARAPCSYKNQHVSETNACNRIQTSTTGWKEAMSSETQFSTQGMILESQDTKSTSGTAIPTKDPVTCENPCIEKVEQTPSWQSSHSDARALFQAAATLRLDGLKTVSAQSVRTKREKLSSGYYQTGAKPGKFFHIGKSFAVLWSEPTRRRCFLLKSTASYRLLHTLGRKDRECHAGCTVGAEYTAVDSLWEIHHARHFERRWSFDRVQKHRSLSRVCAGKGHSRLQSCLTNQRLSITLHILRSHPEAFDSDLTRSAASIAEPLSWAALRRSTRPEDIAHRLMSIFPMDMPMLYGEGVKRAFIRQLEEIMKESEDHLLFAWTDPEVPYVNSGSMNGATLSQHHAKNGSSVDVFWPISTGSIALHYLQHPPLWLSRATGEAEVYHVKRMNPVRKGETQEVLPGCKLPLAEASSAFTDRLSLPGPKIDTDGVQLGTSGLPSSLEALRNLRMLD